MSSLDARVSVTLAGFSAILTLVPDLTDPEIQSLHHVAEPGSFRNISVQLS